MRNGRAALRQRHADPSQPGGEVRKDVAHGVCGQCFRRALLWLPGRVCGKCLEKIQAQMLAALEEMEEADG